MDKRFMTVMLLFSVLFAYGQQRNVKEIEKLFKEVGDVKAMLDANSFQEKNFNKTIIISESTPGLNDIEKKLLTEYSQVAFMCNIASKPFNCYFVKDSENKRGIIGLDGNIIVPPLSGNICNVPNGKDFGILLVGELSRTSSQEIILEWSQSIRDYGILGLFSGLVVNADKPTIKSLFPINDYIFLSLGSRGNGRFDVFTMKVVGDDVLWGIVDMNGKQILPNAYTGFIRKSHFLDTGNIGIWGKWVGTTEMDMTEALNYSRDLKADTQQRRIELASALNNFGEAVINTAETIQTINNVSSDAGLSNGSGISGDLPSQYNKWANLAKRHYDSLTNLGASEKKDGKDIGGTTGQGMSPSNYTQMKKSLREAQNEMKRIRQKAKQQGVNIPKSEYEDIQVKY